MQDPTLLDRLREAAARSFPGHSILAAYAFGSRMAGHERPDSDLDVGYYLENYSSGATLPLHEELELALGLEEAVGIPVDFRNLAEAPLELRGRVLEDGARVFSGDPVERVALERTVLARYHDYKFEFQAMHEMRLQRVAERGL